jgi:tetratricopeptide (TPR) repeat protein
VIHINPEDAEAHYHRANVKVDLEDLESALYDMDKAIEYDGKNGHYYLNRGNIKRQLEMDQEACEDWEKAKSLGESKGNFYLKQYCNQ